MIDQGDVRDANKLLYELELKLRSLYVQSKRPFTNVTEKALIERDARMFASGMLRGTHDFISYCRSGE